MLLLLLNTSALSQAVTQVFVSPAKLAIANCRGSVWLYCMNNSVDTVSQIFPPRLEATLTAGSYSEKVVLSLADNGENRTRIPSGGFVKEEYLFQIPATITGAATLAVTNYNTLEFYVEDCSLITHMKDQGSTAPPLAAAKKSGSLFTGLRGLSTYEPIYFLLGSYPAAEFQFSLKYKILGLNSRWNPLANTYFGYTQTSFWDLFSSDPSFYDTSYKPSLFLYYQDVLRPKYETFFHLDLQGGGEHESNGRGGAMERSLYTLYFQPTATFDLPDSLQLRLQPRVWYYADVGANNPDISDYRGHADLTAALTWTSEEGKKIQLASRFRIGDQGNHAGLLFDLRFDLPFASVRFNPTIQIQYFTGFGQTFRQYDQSSEGLRAGLCLWY